MLDQRVCSPWDSSKFNSDFIINLHYLYFIEKQSKNLNKMNICFLDRTDNIHYIILPHRPLDRTGNKHNRVVPHRQINWFWSLKNNVEKKEENFGGEIKSKWHNDWPQSS